MFSERVQISIFHVRVNWIWVCFGHENRGHTVDGKIAGTSGLKVQAYDERVVKKHYW